MDKEFVISGKKTATLKTIFTRMLIGGILGWVVYVIGTFADSILGGTFLGEEALAAIEIVTPLSSIVYFVSYLICTGCGLLHAKYIGKNDFERAKKVFSTGFLFAIISGIILALVFFLIKESWLDLYGLEVGSNIRKYASDYYIPFIFFALYTPVGLQIYNSIVCDGDVYFTVASDVTSAGLNLIISLLLLNLTKLGTLGLSLATVVSTFISYLVFIPRFFTKANTLHFKFAFSFKDLGTSIKLSTSSFLSMLAVAAIDIIMNLYITNTWGASYTAPYAIVNFSLEIASALVLVGSALSTMANFAIGEGNTKDIKDLVKFATKTGLYIGLFFSVLFIGLTPFWPSIFGLENDVYIQATYFASISIGLTYIPQTYMHTVCAFYTSYEKMSVSLIGSVTNAFVFPLVCPIVLSLIFGSYNAFVVGFAVSNICSVLSVIGYCLIKYKGKVFYIPEVEKEMCSIDFRIDNESISKAVETLRDVLTDYNIDPIISNRAQLIMEESLNITLQKNKKKIYGRIIVGLNDERLKLIVKDTGKIFDVVDPNQQVTSLSQYVFVMGTQTANKSINYVASNLNGNRYEFNIK